MTGRERQQSPQKQTDHIAPLSTSILELGQPHKLPHVIQEAGPVDQYFM